MSRFRGPGIRGLYRSILVDYFDLCHDFESQELEVCITNILVYYADFCQDLRPMSYRFV